MSELKQTDARFPDWEPDDRTPKSTILYHMSYAHERQASAEGIEWWGFYIQHWKRKYSRQELLDIHLKYHGGVLPKLNVEDDEGYEVAEG